MFLSKSKFTISTKEIVALIRKSAQATKIYQGRNFARIIDAGVIVGIDATTGRETSIFTIITNKAGEIVTAFPGMPSR